LITAGERTGLLQTIANQQNLEDLLNLRVQVATDDAISPYIRNRGLREAVALCVLKEEVQTTIQHRVYLFRGYVRLLQHFINRHADVACFLSFTAPRY
jgi:hypothetical protein